MGSQAVLDGVARIDWGRLGCTVKMQLKQNSMLTGLAYVQSHIDDNLLYCSLDPYVCWVVGAPNRADSALWGREEIWLRTHGGVNRSPETARRDGAAHRGGATVASEIQNIASFLKNDF